jgi:hypothetical protein
MGTSMEYSKIHNEQSKLSLDNSKLQQEFYGPEHAKPRSTSKHNLSNVHANIPMETRSERPVFVL